MAVSSYEYFFQVLGNWGSSIPLEGQWFVYFDLQSVEALKGDVGNAIKNYDDYANWQISPGVTSSLKNALYNPPMEKLVGCVFARSVVLPGETINTSNNAVNYGGYLGPSTSSNREGYNKLSITFTETNASFIDFIIRPWVILVGYNGLIARNMNSPKNIRCKSINIIQLAKAGKKQSSMAKRKMMTFYNAAPVSLEDSNLTYAADGLNYNKIDFVYDYYDVKEVDSPKFFQNIVTQPSVNTTSPTTTRSLNSGTNGNSGNGTSGSIPGSSIPTIKVKTPSYKTDNPTPQ